MKKLSTIMESMYSKSSLIKGLVVLFVFSSLFFVGCYEWRNIIQPDTATINSHFDVFVSAQDDGNPDNDWTNEDLVDYGLFGVMLPDGWTVKDSIPFTIVCTNPEYSNSGILLYSEARSQTLRDSIPPPPGYYWWGAATRTEASMVFFDSLYIEPRIYTGGTPGDYFLRYAIGDIDYWDRNPADDISNPIPITLIDNTGIGEVLSESNVSLYPNPATNLLNIEFKEYSRELIEMEIIDLTGKVVRTGQLSNNQTTIGLDGLGKGIYFVKLQNGQFSESHKIFIN
jgi:type IX secretion system substrate protein